MKEVSTYSNVSKYSTSISAIYNPLHHHDIIAHRNDVSLLEFISGRTLTQLSEEITSSTDPHIIRLS